MSEEQAQDQTETTREPCAWCGEPSVDRIITRPGRKKKQLAPVCDSHLSHFMAQGVKSENDEIRESTFREDKRKADSAAYFKRIHRR